MEEKKAERRKGKKERVTAPQEDILFLLLGSCFQRAEFTLYSSLHPPLSPIQQPTLQSTKKCLAQ